MSRFDSHMAVLIDCLLVTSRGAVKDKHRVFSYLFAQTAFSQSHVILFS